MLQGKTVLLGVTGSIAAYKIAYLASALKKLHAQVHVLMTKNATNFINPITFESLTGNKCLVDTFDRNFQFQVEHVSIAKQATVLHQNRKQLKRKKMKQLLFPHLLILNRSRMMKLWMLLKINRKKHRTSPLYHRMKNF